MSAKKKPAAALQYLDASFFEHSPKHRAARAEAEASQEIGRLVFSLRTQSGLTPRQLARAAGLTPKSLEKLESGSNPRLALAQLRQVAAALGQRVEVKLVAKGARSKTQTTKSSRARKGGEQGGGPEAPRAQIV